MKDTRYNACPKEKTEKEKQAQVDHLNWIQETDFLCFWFTIVSISPILWRAFSLIRIKAISAEVYKRLNIE